MRQLTLRCAGFGFGITLVVLTAALIAPSPASAQQSPVEEASEWLFPDDAVDERAPVNGCGSQLPGSFDPPDEFLFPGNDHISFNDACNWHDRCYGTKGLPRSYCDLGMYSRMVGKCLDAELVTTVGPCTALAELAHLAVKVGGVSSYNEGQEAACGRDPVNNARAHGDPHLVTLDGLRYSFQAAGEFSLLQESDGTAIVNAQFFPSTDTFSVPNGIAVQVGDSVVAVQRHAETGTVRATVDGQLVSSRLTTLDDGFIMFGSQFAGTDGVVTIRRSDGIRVDVLLHRSRLDLAVDVPVSRTGLEGLLGNNNGDPGDDLQANGQTIRESQVYDGDFRQDWVVSRGDTMFVAQNSGFDYFSARTTSYPVQPLTLDDFSASEQVEARRACQQAGVSENDLDSCTFDILASGDFTAAETAAQSERHATTVSDPGASRLVPDPPLLFPASRGNIEDLRSLLNSGEDPNDGRESDRATPIAFAAQNGHLEAVELLLEAGAVPDLRVSRGFTALTLASQNGHIQIVRVLLDAGSFVDVIDDRSLTPLYLSAQNGNADIVDLLLSRGASASGADQDRAPVDIAAQNGHDAIVRSLRDAGATPSSSALLGAAQNGHVTVVRTLLNGGIDPDIADGEGFTAMHVAAQGGRVDVLTVLVEFQGNVNSRTDSGWTPLHAAASRDQLGAVTFLLRNGADPNTVNDQGFPPVEFSDDPDIIDVLTAGG